MSAATLTLLLGGVPYTPLSEPTLVDWLDPRSLSAGALASWVGRKGVLTLTAAGGARPTASQTSFNGKPGVTGDGVANIMTGALDLSALTAVRIIAGMTDASAATSIPLELTTSAATQDGGLALLLNSSYKFESGGRGTSGLGICGSDSMDLASPCVMSSCPDTSLSFCNRFLRMNSIAYQFFAAANASMAGPLANSTLNVFARSGASLPWAGTFGHIVLLTGNADDAALLRVENFIAQQSGLATHSTPRTVMFCGDSIVLGLAGNTGGYIPQCVNTLGLALTPIRSVGPFFSEVYHRGVSGEKATDVASSLATFAAQVAAAVPAGDAAPIVTVCWGENDLGTGSGSPALVTAITAIVNQIKTTRPNAHIIIQSPVLPTNTGSGAAYFTHLADYNTYAAQFATMCAGLGCTAVAPGVPVQSDGIHPVDGPTGYGVLATNMIAGIQAAF